MSGNSGYVEATKVNLVNLCDVDTILGLPYILLTLESINILMKFPHDKVVFVCDYIVIIKFYQVDYIYKYV
jgi:hypothetical protein